jgi:hypothetical protein
VPPAASTVSLAADTSFSTIDANKNSTWSGVLSGNKTSYTVVMEWGDGTYDSYAVAPGSQTMHHHYAQLASYNLTVSYRDDQNQSHYQQFAVVSDDAAALAALQTADTTSTRTIQPNTLAGLYGLFITAVCLTALIRLHASPFAYAPIRIHHA